MPDAPTAADLRSELEAKCSELAGVRERGGHWYEDGKGPRVLRTAEVFRRIQEIARLTAITERTEHRAMVLARQKPKPKPKRRARKPKPAPAPEPEKTED